MRLKTIAKWLAGLVVGLAAAGFGAWATSPDPQFNPASFEDEPLVQQIAPLEEAITLAQVRAADGGTRTLLVLARTGESVTGIDLAELGAPATSDPLAALAASDLAPVRAGRAGALPQVTVAIDALLPSGPAGTRHIGTGTNFPEHAAEADSSAVFQFPKFGAASPARTQVQAQPGILLDYEVEICVRFDRPLRTLADFDKAVKAFFLCGDFTNRNALINLADPDNLDSGSGFSDAKSGPDFFPTGPFLVIPADWKAFVVNVRMTTTVNGAPRQDARGGEMTLDFRALAQKAFTDMSTARFLYRGSYTKLMPDGAIPPTATLMSGTAEGTIFTPPTRADLIEAGLAYAAAGGPLARQSALDIARRKFIANELAGGHYLQPGDVVRHDSNALGDIVIAVVRR
ncbi:MAG: fumarylacetoacetate hydrolase family protein [Erythrobacter sp.]|uniref:fumarylacetoacetate hydrolase family protein n=1 Tax=Erythrobacter sp. TaxID=1042 RepID=UPI0025FDEB33|nr:fumarylacetoacetate hydrolase family protein [Erythrobacter sp.]MCL9998768.1 fumarylacetoacetate hydrolase family protein [Erythrobacter sp.]